MQWQRGKRNRERELSGRAVPAAEESLARLAGGGVVLAGFFSAKENHDAAMDVAAAVLGALGARVVARAVQRRGVSHGGVARMPLPFSSRTVFSPGKLREVAQLQAQTGAAAVVFTNDLTDRQKYVLTRVFGVPAISLSSLAPQDSRPGSPA